MADHAWVLRKNGKRADARRLLEQAWELAQSRRGLDDADTLKAASLLRRGLARGGQLPARRAIAEPRPALTARTALGRDHPTTQTVQNMVERQCVGHGRTDGSAIA